MDPCTCRAYMWFGCHKLKDRGKVWQGQGQGWRWLVAALLKAQMVAKSQAATIGRAAEMGEGWEPPGRAMPSWVVFIKVSPKMFRYLLHLFAASKCWMNLEMEINKYQLVSESMFWSVLSFESLFLIRKSYSCSGWSGMISRKIADLLSSRTSLMFLYQVVMTECIKIQQSDPEHPKIAEGRTKIVKH